MQQISLSELPQAAPYQCYSCGTGDSARGPFGDLGIHVDYHGAVILCKLCLDYVAGSFGYLSVEKFDETFEYVEKLESHIIELREIERALRGTLEQLISNDFVGDVELVDSSMRFDFARLLTEQYEAAREVLREFHEKLDSESPDGEGELGPEGAGISESFDDERMAILSGSPTGTKPFQL